MDDGEDWFEEYCAESDCSDYGLEDAGSSDYDHAGDQDEQQNDAHVEEEPAASSARHGYVVMSEAEVRERQEVEVSSICSVLQVPRAWACALLVRYDWDLGRVQDAWFTNEEAVRGDLGLLLEGDVGRRAVALGKKLLKCRICLEDECPCDQMSSAACGHLFCDVCWGVYIHTAVADGPGCLTLRCPDPGCRVIISRDMVERFATDEDAHKYSRYLFRSFVGGDKKLKWCPAPDCQFVVELVEGEVFDVRCRCSHCFCWNCGEEAHRPVGCETVAKWALKNSTEAENTEWILAYCKPCPKCHRQIEKNAGCMHMTCRAPCRYEFCWLCLGAWFRHGESTGGFYACNVYKHAKEAGEMDEEDLRRRRARDSMERYTHYFERWAANHMSRQKALGVLAGLEEEQVERLKDMYSQPHGQLKFVKEAWLQIAECRRVLKWSYTYGYYLAPGDGREKEFFEYLQGEAEAQLDILHSCAENQIRHFLDSTACPPLEEFLRYRSRLVGSTSVVQHYFKNLVRALESGLKQVELPPEAGASGVAALFHELDI
ncbi:hypothetical protein Taro_053107 [Colocasia esculenta]|uniref:RBR-type E3 ubiquitin transferase n=1 Tax=Colocasia esculenta TaxID=4460 RepID=A0A843XLL5_COLES|nr:hypothetical protein [Colocasia esculenta]